MPYTLLVLLCCCHWLADFSHLQRPWMLQAKTTGSPAAVILLHAVVHSLLMGICLSFFVSSKLLLYLMLFQCVTHFAIDVWKGKMNVWFPPLRDPRNQFHWIVFGFDQLLHHIVIISMVYLVYNTPTFMQ